MTASGVRLSTGLVGEGVTVGLDVDEDVGLGCSVCVTVGVALAVLVAVGLPATVAVVVAVGAAIDAVAVAVEAGRVAVGVAAGRPSSSSLQPLNESASDAHTASHEYRMPMPFLPCAPQGRDAAPIPCGHLNGSGAFASRLRLPSEDPVLP